MIKNLRNSVGILHLKGLYASWSIEQIVV